ncbi:HU family DNA-binding protein [Streptomyces sp. ST2-7A]|uniref:HU family DNA-binding protein n=1 Tax=Streptomyces sp. ST2-7A TaxID=2907214 RepID=UPI001F4734AA|nr:HU family DNA-binding protein [Streptomyces sp. ST2-7A]MCE7079912.1 HU family DNA-binding protein [Streptomyces sp. ST2-7A]
MNKAQLVEAIADKLGGRQQAALAVDIVLDAIIRATVAGERVSVTGFGSFEKVERPARYARNPQTGERVRVKKTAVPRFRAGQGFKDLVAGSKKLPKNDVAVKKAPKGSLSGGTTTKKATAKKTTAKKSTTTRSATAKKAAAGKKAGAAKSTTAKKTTTARDTGAAKKTGAKKTAKKAQAKKTGAGNAPARKATGRRTTAKRTATRSK